VVTIEVDSQVMDLLSRHAKPFVDTPNSVLRRLLGLGGEVTGVAPTPVPVPATTTPSRAPEPTRSTVSRTVGRHTSDPDKGDRHEFISRILAAEFGGRFRVRSPYQMMFESDEQLVYFQNFNATGSHNLWFRLNDRPLGILRDTRKRAFVCLTNPAEGFAFLLPIDDVLDHARRTNWTRSEIEVNIDPATSKWREFEWDLSRYRKSY
jgi:hypothetical protein